MTHGLSMNSMSKVRCCRNYMQTAITFCIILSITVFTVVAVNVADLDAAGKCLFSLTVSCGLSTLLSLAILNFKRNLLYDLVQSLCKYSYLVDTYQPRSFNVLKLISLFLALSPCIGMTLMNICTPLYVTFFDPGDFFSKYFYMLINHTLWNCYESTIASNDIYNCDYVVPIIGLILVAIWSIIMFSCLIHSVGIITIFNLTLHYIFQCLKRSYSQEEAHPNVSLFSELTTENAKKFIKLHKELGDLVQMADRTFREVNFIISATEIFCVIVSLRCMDFTNIKENNILELLPTTTVLAGTFVARTLCAGKVNYEVNQRTP